MGDALQVLSEIAPAFRIGAAFVLILAMLAGLGVRPLRRAVLLAAVVCGAIVYATNELLSFAHGLTASNVDKVWTGVSLVLLGIFLVRGRAMRLAAPSRALALRAREGVARVYAWSLRGAAFLPLLLVLLTVLVVALVAAPGTWDSQTYHLARVENWIHNRSIDHFPTNIGRQVFMPPFAEWCVMHFQILTGGDRLANLVQWLAWVGCGIAGSLVARTLGASAVGQMLAAALVASSPMAIFQASSTQNDLVAAFWLLTTAALGLDLLMNRTGRRLGWATLAVGAAMGLAMLTKATTYLYLAPLCFMLAIAAIRLLGWWRTLAIVPAIATLALAINLPHFSRNYITCGHPLGPQKEDPNHPTNWKYRNDIKNPNVLLSNIARNLANELSPPDLSSLTRIPWVDSIIVDTLKDLDQYVDPATRRKGLIGTVVAFHQWLDLDPSDPRITWSSMAFDPPMWWNCEDHAGSPLHVLLLAAAAVTLPFPRWRYRWLAGGLLGVVLVGFAIFCWELRWQPWHARLLLPILLLAAPFTAAAIELGWSRPVAVVLMLLLICAAVPPAINCRTRPVFASDVTPERALFGKASIFSQPRWRTRMFALAGWEVHYKRVAADLARQGFRRIGIVSGFEAWEYPLWCALRETGLKFQVQHVRVTNETQSLAADPRFADFRPQVIINLNAGLAMEVVEPPLAAAAAVP